MAKQACLKIGNLSCRRKLMTDRAFETYSQSRVYKQAGQGICEDTLITLTRDVDIVMQQPRTSAGLVRNGNVHPWPSTWRVMSLQRLSCLQLIIERHFNFQTSP